MTAATSTKHEPPTDARSPGSHVLVVDDDPAICAAYAEILSARGYAVAAAGSRADALAQLDGIEAPFDVLIIDLTLPDADGAELARAICDRIGNLPALFVTGWVDEFWDLSAAPGRWLVMQKPISVPGLIDAVDWLVGKRDSRPS